jgi:hypothetical protein
MDCLEFQHRLPELLDSGRKVEMEPHARECAACAGLVADLTAIANEASNLPLLDPPDRLWVNLRRQLQAEGLIQEPASAGGVLLPERRPWFSLRWATAVAAVVLAVGGFQVMHQTPVAPPANSTVAEFEPEDAAVLAAVERTSPRAKPVYEKNLRQVNASIHEARRLVKERPGDREAQGYLRDAYAQKALIYDKATTRSLE